MRALLFAFAMAAAVVANVPAAHAQHCVELGCQERCFHTGYGVRCHVRCRRRCFREPDPYYRPPPDPPRYHAPAPVYTPSTSTPSLPPELVVGGVLLLIIGVIATLASGAEVDRINREIAKVEEDIAATQSEMHATRDRTQQISDYIADVEHEHYQRGRRHADEEWTGE